jgi:acyl-coenzyme A thioesterase PaaI-like protein
MGGTRDYRMQTTEALLRRSLDADGAGVRLTLDPAFQGLPGTAHGGSVLAAFDAVAAVGGIRRVSGVYRRRVPPGVPLRLDVHRAEGRVACRVLEGDTVLVEGQVAPSVLAGTSAAVDEAGGTPLPVSNTCFVCGLDNVAGLRARLRFDEHDVFGVWTPPERFRADRGGLAPLALTSLLDEAAFWLGALASGESGMTADLAVTLADGVPLDTPVVVRGERGRVRPLASDQRYWQTHTVASDAAGRVVAAADITFVAIRGTARKLSGWLNPLNPPGLLPRIFPAYA